MANYRFWEVEGRKELFVEGFARKGSGKTPLKKKKKKILQTSSSTDTHAPGPSAPLRLPTIQHSDCALPESIDELDKFQEDHDEGDSSCLSEEDGSLSEDSWSEEDDEAIDPSFGCSRSPWRQPPGSQPPLMDQPVHPQEPPTEVHSPPSSPSAKRPCRQWTRGAVQRGRGRGKGSSRLQNGGASCPSNSQSPPPCTNPDLQGERWMDRDEPDRKPALHPFAPARTPGAQLDFTKEYSPLDLFQLTFSQNTIKTLCFNTNKKASQKQTRGWKTPWSPVTPDELLRCFGVVISMGLVQCPEVRDYWSSRKCYSLPFPRSVFARNRFEAIIQALHMSDPDEDRKNDALKGTDKYDHLFRLRPLIGDVEAACRAFYQPRQQLSIDERMVATKGRFGMKQYMKAKPTKWGFKLFVLSDSSNGYTCDFNMYTGKQKSQSGKGISQDAVIELLTPYFGTGYHVYVDNWYTSTSLFTELKQRQFGACGTYRENGTGFPVVQANDMPKKAARGTIKWLRKDDVLYVKWMDSREVRMCSTFHKAFEGDTVGRKVKSTGGTWAISQVPIPASVRDYNKYMGGMNLPDAQLKYYMIRRKTTKWYKVLLFHFIDVAIVNGFLLHKELAAQAVKDAHSQGISGGVS
ncbi:hypothetical protein GJAV_G00073640 [Gymnothorax javanicus]|nr:hypothetical protein GJAV_G00073640 [Gymnothorax javanicus]